MLRPALFFSLVPLSLWLLGCSSESPERPPVGDLGTSQPGGGTVGGSAGDSGTDSGLATTQTGTVVSYNDDGFVLTSPYTQAATIHLLSQTSSKTTDVDYDGVNFQAEVQDETLYWVLAQPTLDVATYPTLTQQTPDAQSWTVPVLRKEILAEMLSTLNSPAQPSDNRAHLIVTVVDDKGQGVANVKPSVVGAPDIAFNDAGLWSDADTVTTSTGQFVAYNVAASSLPGDDYTVILTGSADGEFKVRAVSGAVTLVTLAVQ